jgi:protein-arginine kinase activator protein McsA
MAITKCKRKQLEVKLVKCPVCERLHQPDVEFGPFCCASCLQTVIRPLIVITIETSRKR